MDDGSPDRSGFVFHTNSFTLAEVELLVKTLKNKFNLNCSIQTRNDRVIKPHLIYVKQDSFTKLVSLVEPYVIPHFKYKLKLRGSFINSLLDK